VVEISTFLVSNVNDICSGVCGVSVSRCPDHLFINEYIFILIIVW
jgi:hypothetical protein